MQGKDYFAQKQSIKHTKKKKNIFLKCAALNLVYKSDYVLRVHIEHALCFALTIHSAIPYSSRIRIAIQHYENVSRLFHFESNNNNSTQTFAAVFFQTFFYHKLEYLFLCFNLERKKNHNNLSIINKFKFYFEKKNEKFNIKAKFLINVKRNCFFPKESCHCLQMHI